MPESGWQRCFKDPILLPGGKSLHTLRDAAGYITGLPKEQSDLAQWQIAIDADAVQPRGRPYACAHRVHEGA